MDFEGLFWIALLIFYFVVRAVGGKKSKPSPGPTGGRRPRPDRSRTAPSPSQADPELDDALREIRRALGFPVEEREERRAPEQAEPAEAHAGETEAEVARRRASEAEERRRRQAVRDAELEKSKQAQRTRQQEASRRRDVQEAERQRELLERAEAAEARDRRGIPKPQVRRRPASVGAHPLESSFTEEDIFERTGRHAHEGTAQADERTVAKRRELSSLQDRLHNRSSLREAFILKEVLDKPLSMRRRR